MRLTLCRSVPLSRSGSAATVLMRSIVLACLCVIVAGCTGERSDDEGGETAGTGNTSGSEIATQDPDSPASGGEAPSQGKSSIGLTDDSGSTGDDSPAESASPLDDAVASQAEKPELAAEGADDPEVETAEPVAPHEELLPLIDKSWVRLHPRYEVWLDPAGKQVIVGGRICFRKGPLEMFACPQRTKEHESIVSTVSNGEIIHTGLLATGAVPGSPVAWDPDFVPPSGPVVDILVKWSDEDDIKEANAKQWVLDASTNEAMKYDWVYAGSGEWIDSNNPGYREFFADGGDLICVTNFTTALLDVRVESTPNNAGLMFYAYTDRIPPLGKPVLLFLKPKFDGGAAATDDAAATSEAEGAAADSDKSTATPGSDASAGGTEMPEEAADGDDG